MKRISFEPFREWFGFTRRERRSTFILLFLIIAVTGLRYIIPSRQITFEEIPAAAADTVKKQSTFAGRSGRQHQLLDINKCDSAALEALPGIGPVLAVRIIKYRSLLGGFARVEQLREVYGLPEETYAIISARVFADSLEVRRININSADYRQLIRIPYFERYEVTAILKYRELNGNISGISEMIDNKLVPHEAAKKAGPYMEF